LKQTPPDSQSETRRHPADGLPNIASIPPGSPFLPTLVDTLFDGTLIDGFVPNDDPLALANITIWVPTRRAVRALADAFVTRFEGQSAMLPSIRALGDVDGDDLLFSPAEADLHPSLEPVIEPIRKQLILSRLVNAWSNSLKPEQRSLYEGADIVMPASMSDAIWFATDLADLMDAVATEEADWAALVDLVPDDYANWWKLTLEFLQIATTNWPGILDELNQQDGASLRSEMLRKQADSYRKFGAPGPVIAAGSTGSIPATADLLKSIAHMEHGIVVLPALDRDLDDETWEKIDLPNNERDDYGAASGHPQYGLKKLLSRLGTSRTMQEIRHLDGSVNPVSGALRLREKLVSEALRPAQSTGQWQDLISVVSPEQSQQALAGVSLVEARDEREEALVIAMALRETLEQRHQTAALVTPDRNLARRVAAEMRRFGLEINDSAGQPLRKTTIGDFVRLVVRVGFAAPDPIALISLLKHPLTLLGETPARARRAANLFELVILRGAISPPAFGQFASHVEKVETSMEGGTKRIARSVRRISQRDWKLIHALASRLDSLLLPDLNDDCINGLDQLTTTTIQLLETFGVDASGELDRLYATEHGKQIAGFLGDLLTHGALLQSSFAQWPDVFDALFEPQVTRPTSGAHPRVTILGPLESRLQTYDRVVLGGMNEKSWPAATRNGAFLSRPMKSGLGLPPPERRTGLAAHDFQVLMGMKDVVLTRSLKSDNAPTVASRWLQRLMIVSGPSVSDAMRQRGQQYLDWADQIDAAKGAPRPCSQPRPKPSVALRPTTLSITEIETWIEDPYAIYARHILKLEPLAPLVRQADAREKGTLYHAIFEDFIRQVNDPFADTAWEQLLVIATDHFESLALPREIQAYWQPRLHQVARLFLDWHRDHLDQVERVHVELSGRTDEGLDGFVLRGRADRIDLLKDGRLALIDYKTGLQPSAKSVADLESPQLPLEAAMARHGAFGPDLAREAAWLGYVRLRPTDTLKVDRIGTDESRTAKASALSTQVWKNLADMISAYRDPNKDYRSKARPAAKKQWEGDFDHLARVREWSFADDGEGEA